MAVDSSALRDAIRVFAEEVAQGAARRALDTVRPGVPVKSGELRGSEFDRSAGTHIEFGYEADQALYTDEGTRAHPIPTPVAFYWENEGINIIMVPQGPRARFETADGTVVVMGKENVNHPGTARQGWFSDIVGDSDALDGLLDIVQEVAEVITVFA